MISKAAYLLLFFSKLPNANILPSQLYHDIQSIFIDSVFCIAKLQINCLDFCLYLVFNGTDAVERFLAIAA